MKYITLAFLLLGSLNLFAQQSQVMKNKPAALKKCVGVLTTDGNVTYKEDCLSPSKTVVKKGTYPTGVQGAVDTPEKAMELYNNTKDKAFSLEKDKDTD